MARVNAYHFSFIQLCVYYGDFSVNASAGWLSLRHGWQGPEHQWTSPYNAKMRLKAATSRQSLRRLCGESGTYLTTVSVLPLWTCFTRTVGQSAACLHYAGPLHVWRSLGSCFWTQALRSTPNPDRDTAAPVARLPLRVSHAPHALPLTLLPPIEHRLKPCTARE